MPSLSLMFIDFRRLRIANVRTSRDRGISWRFLVEMSRDDFRAFFKRVSAIVELCRPVSGCVGQGSSEREKRAQRWAQYRFWELSQCFAEQILQSPGLCQRSHEAENQCSEFSEFSETANQAGRQSE